MTAGNALGTAQSLDEDVRSEHCDDPLGMPVYFDTNVIRYLRSGLRDHALSQEEKQCAVLSPISILELVAQIATAPDPDDVLASIHAMAAWMDVGRSELLGWADA